MCAAMRLSFGSADCVPVMSMPVIVAVKVMAVIALFKSNVANPNEVLGAPPLVVGVVGGFSAALVSVATRMTSAFAQEAAARIANITDRVDRSLSMARIIWQKALRDRYEYLTMWAFINKTARFVGHESTFVGHERRIRRLIILPCRMLFCAGAH